MTHSPTPTELLALKTANAALLNSPDSFCDMVATVVFALGSAQLLQSPETANELSQLRARVAELEAAHPAPAGLSEIELRRTAPGTYRCVCGHWDNVHGPFCFAEVCECGSFTHPGPEHHIYRTARLLEDQ